ncbi:hypothetical protein LIER_06604 [Lithospermum erythrorhizon]|uniref:DUF1985 domain-containing protein n=1 Tax=Lithospermum erythrorhizon TaxID=34254 RepID=A0AAV3P5T0_LITER
MICLVDDPELFNSYPWGQMVYEDLVKEWAHMFNRIKGPGFAHLKVRTFPFAIQAWVLKCLMSEFSAVLARSAFDYLVVFFWHLPFMRITPVAGELEKDYFKSARALHTTTSLSYVLNKVDGDENVPGFLNLNLAFKKLDRKKDTMWEKVVHVGGEGDMYGGG